MRPLVPRPQDLRHPDSRFTSGGQPPKVGPELFRTSLVLNLGKKKAKIHFSANPDRCYKCGGIGHYSKVCPHKNLALCIQDNTEEEVYGDQQTFDDETGIDETVDIVQAPSDDDGEREDSYLVIMRPYSS